MKGKFEAGDKHWNWKGGVCSPIDMICKNCESKFVSNKSSRIVFCCLDCYFSYRRKNNHLYKRPKISKEGKRSQRKKMNLHFSNPEFRIKHSLAVKNAMKRPDVQIKIRKQRMMPMSELAKKKISKALHGKRPGNFRKIIRTKQAWFECKNGRKFYMLSSWERNIARYLDLLLKSGEILSWDYEPKKFIFHKINYGKRTYLPDFMVTEKNGKIYYIEVKGYMDAASKTKLNRMKRYYPKVEIRIIGKDEYKYLSVQLKRLMPGWE